MYFEMYNALEYPYTGRYSIKWYPVFNTELAHTRYRGTGISLHVKIKSTFTKFLLYSYFNYARNEPLDSMWTRYLLKSLNSSQVGRNTMMLGTSVLEPGYDLHTTGTVPLAFIK